MSVTPAVFLSLIGIICIGAFFVGLRFRTFDSGVGTLSVDQVRLFGLVMMIFAPVMFIVMCVAVLSGATGPLKY